MSVCESGGNYVHGESIEAHTGICLPYVPQRLGLEWVRKFFVDYVFLTCKHGLFLQL